MSQHRRTRASRIGLIAAPLAVGALVLAGCSGTSSDNSSTSGGPQQFSFTYVTSNNIESAFEAIAKVYMQEHPEVKITLNAQPNDQYDQTLRTQLQAGNASDLVETSPGTGQGRSLIPLAKAGFLEPLNDKATALVPENSKSQFILNGKTYGAPTDLTFIGMVENETAAKAAGVSTFPADWDSLKAACTSAKSAGKSFAVLAGAAAPNTGLLAMVIAATRVYADNPKWDQDRADKKVTFADSDGWKAALKTVTDLKDAGCFQSGVEGAGFDAITNGMAQGTSVASFIPAPSVAQLASAAKDQTFAVQAFPPAASSDKPFGFASINYALSITKASKNKAAAQAFLDWLGEPANAKKFADIDGGLPVSGVGDLDLSKTPYAPVADILKSGDYTGLPNSNWSNAAVYDALSTGVQGLLTGQKSVSDVLKAMDAAWDQ
ncbi:ABC transporter substrate-binding protein [Microbacterium sp.]|uniref:ABC transporter substrate-binding protein n=1 Tax=Microbacterium sp. TaxID=51671 RepID=UPI000925B417|nr:extracellular solute-binding protein [Microbacterium sp.]MBN9170165.1 extracellular solute-binding protein [Microbacterium sp.]MBN9194156.1 extracellular solute-binding protein [Microbacterium sp.]OJU68499.1 MAG: sugar ABC transporter substrate-binding protein [Microbacterium sp. 70-38]